MTMIIMRRSIELLLFECPSRMTRGQHNTTSYKLQRILRNQFYEIGGNDGRVSVFYVVFSKRVSAFCDAYIHILLYCFVREVINALMKSIACNREWQRIQFNSATARDNWINLRIIQRGMVVGIGGIYRNEECLLSY